MKKQLTWLNYEILCTASILREVYKLRVTEFKISSTVILFMYHATLHNLSAPILWNLQSRKDIRTLDLASSTSQRIRKPH